MSTKDTTWGCYTSFYDTYSCVASKPSSEIPRVAFGTLGQPCRVSLTSPPRLQHDSIVQHKTLNNAQLETNQLPPSAQLMIVFTFARASSFCNRILATFCRSSVSVKLLMCRPPYENRLLMAASTLSSQTTAPHKREIFIVHYPRLLLYVCTSLAAISTYTGSLFSAYPTAVDRI